VAISRLATGVLALAFVQAPATATAEPERSLKEPFSAAGVRAGPGGVDDTPLAEQCDGSRALALSSVTSQCRQWMIEWRQDGKVWGVTVAPTSSAVISMRDRTMSFVRDDARFFDLAVDRRFTSPSPPICDLCRARDPAGASGMFGDGQRFAGSEVRRAIVATVPKLDALQKALLEQHTVRMRDVARYAREPKTAKAAKQYAKALRTAIFDLARARLLLENANVLQSKPLVDQADKLVGGRTTALEKDYAALQDAIANELKQRYGGRWDQEGSDSAGKHLQVDFERLAVRASHVDDSSKSVWFEGAINLDGSVTGHSLVAPKDGKTSCTDHTVACGFERVPAVLRFSRRAGASQGKSDVVELWFQQGGWLRAPLFSR
jgi:hypothetical protein